MGGYQTLTTGRHGRRDHNPGAALSKHPNIPDPTSNIDFPGEQSTDFCARVLGTLRDGVIVQDLGGRVEWLNGAARQMFGRSLANAVIDMRPGGGDGAFRYDPDSPLFHELQLVRHQRHDGGAFWNQQNFTIVPSGSEGVDPHVVITCRDISDQIATEARLRTIRNEMRHAAFHDELTGLGNRRLLHRMLSAQSGQQRVGLLQLDLDRFKEINDTLGHAVGDMALRHVAQAMRRTCEGRDLACRLGGDEFVLVCRDISSPAALIHRAERLLQEIAAPLDSNGRPFRVHCSIGASIGACRPSDFDTLLQQADQALYAAKEQGRGRIVLFSPALGRAQKEQTRMIHELQEALLGQQLMVHLQPQLDLHSGQVSLCEALIRWQHPRHGLLVPYDFLSIAQRAGLLADLDYRALDLSLDALMRLREAGFSDITLAINVSAEILADRAYPDHLEQALRVRGISARDICMEVTESTILDHGEGAVGDAVRRIRAMGARVALDDFATGYGGIDRMAALDIDAIKLDPSLIARICEDARGRIIVGGIITLCRRLNTQVIAEGVETPEQLQALRKLRCPAIQGFVLAHPMPVDQMLQWLRENR